MLDCWTPMDCMVTGSQTEAAIFSRTQVFQKSGSLKEEIRFFCHEDSFKTDDNSQQPWRVSLCDFQAYTLNMFGAQYQWVVAGGGTAGWRPGSQVSGCAANSVLTAADGSIRIQIRQLSHTNTPGVSGRVRNHHHIPTDRPVCVVFSYIWSPENRAGLWHRWHRKLPRVHNIRGYRKRRFSTWLYTC